MVCVISKRYEGPCLHFTHLRSVVSAPVDRCEQWLWMFRKRSYQRPMSIDRTRIDKRRRCCTVRTLNLEGVLYHALKQEHSRGTSHVQTCVFAFTGEIVVQVRSGSMRDLGMEIRCLYLPVKKQNEEIGIRSESLCSILLAFRRIDTQARYS